jgi:hypothetical protein
MAFGFSGHCQSVQFRETLYFKKMVYSTSVSCEKTTLCKKKTPGYAFCKMTTVKHTMPSHFSLFVHKLQTTPPKPNPSTHHTHTHNLFLSTSLAFLSTAPSTPLSATSLHKHHK